MQRRMSLPWFLATLSAVFGAVFAAFSTLDFIAHLDRQLHELHCSFIPGMTAATASAESGCRAVMTSPYSSWWRTTYWGGVPIALLALAVFVFFVFLLLDLLRRDVLSDRRFTRSLLLGSVLPLAASALYFTIAMTEIHALCKLCIGIYFSSIGLFVGSILLYRQSGRSLSSKPALTWIYALEAAVFVGASVLLYISLVPDYTKQVQACGSLPKAEDKQGALFSVKNGIGPPLLEVLDPLCPACKAFQARLGAEETEAPLSVLLFPLDNECNWMLSQAVHPGACMVSRALLCSGSDFVAMRDFIFANQEEFRIVASKQPEQVEAKLVQRFPQVKGCINRSETKMRLNQMLRYAVDNRLPITTPQLYVANRRLCDEDTDLGLDYALSALFQLPPVASGAHQ